MCEHAQLLQSCWTLCDLWTIASQAPLSTGFSRQEYWSGLPYLPPEDLPNPGIKPMSPALAGGFFTTELPMLCYAKSLQSCLTLCDPIDGSHQAPPSLGFSRQEHWSGLPFPSPMQESEKRKGSHSVMSNS